MGGSIANTKIWDIYINNDVLKALSVCFFAFFRLYHIFFVLFWNRIESNAISFSYTHTHIHLRRICTSRRIDKGLKFEDVDARFNVNGFLKDFNKYLQYFNNSNIKIIFLWKNVFARDVSIKSYRKSLNVYSCTFPHIYIFLRFRLRRKHNEHYLITILQICNIFGLRVWAKIVNQSSVYSRYCEMFCIYMHGTWIPSTKIGQISFQAATQNLASLIYEALSFVKWSLNFSVFYRKCMQPFWTLPFYLNCEMSFFLYLPLCIHLHPSTYFHAVLLCVITILRFFAIFITVLFVRLCCFRQSLNLAYCFHSHFPILLKKTFIFQKKPFDSWMCLLIGICHAACNLERLTIGLTSCLLKI